MSTYTQIVYRIVLDTKNKEHTLLKELMQSSDGYITEQNTLTTDES